MKKILFVFALVAIIATGTAFADHPGGFGIGFESGLHVDLDPSKTKISGGSLTLKFQELPIFWTINVASFDPFYTGFSGDYYFIHNPISGDFHWYLGFGLGLSLWTYEEKVDETKLGIAVTGRVPVGVSWQPLDFLELYAQAVPRIGINFSEGKLYDKFLVTNLGIRFWP